MINLTQKVKFLVCSGGVAMLALTATPAQAITFVSSRTALGGNDFVDWSSPLSPVSAPIGTRFTISSAGGLIVTVSQNGAPGEVRQQNTGSTVGVDSPSNSNATQNSTFWNGNFAPNDTVYWNKGNGALSLAFATPVSSVGAQLNSLFYQDSDAAAADPATENPPSTSPFRGTITAFYGNSGASATFTANGVTNALADNSAAFFGVQSDSADITRIVFDSFDIPTNTAYFNYAINSVSIGNPTAVPEPLTIVGSVLGGAAAFKMRKRLKVDNKL